MCGAGAASHAGEAEENVRAGCIAPMENTFSLCRIVCSSENNNNQFACLRPFRRFNANQQRKE